MVIVKQPFPLVLNKNKQLMEDQLQVQLLTASCTQISSVSKISGLVVFEVKQGSMKIMENEIQQIGMIVRDCDSFFIYLHFCFRNLQI